MVADPSRRYTARQVLAHPWMLTVAPDMPLHNTLTQLKRFNARRKLKAAMGAVRATVRVRLLVSSIIAARAEVGHTPLTPIGTPAAAAPAGGAGQTML